MARQLLVEAVHHLVVEERLREATLEAQHLQERHRLVCQVTYKQLALKVAVVEEEAEEVGQRST